MTVDLSPCERRVRRRGDGDVEIGAGFRLAFALHSRGGHMLVAADRRRSVRVDLREPVFLTLCGHEYPAELLNLSSSGMLFTSEASLRPGDRIDVRIEFKFWSHVFR